MVGTAEGVAQKAAEVAKENFERLGFKVRMRLVTQDAMYIQVLQRAARERRDLPERRPGARTSPTARRSSTRRSTARTSSRQQNSNWPQLDDKALNAEMDKAKRSAIRRSGRRRGPTIDKKLTGMAPSVLWIWDTTPLIASADVNPVASRQNSMWDLAWISLK